VLTFDVTGLSPGTTLISVRSPQQLGPAFMVVTVAAPGESVRWPGGVTFDTDFVVRRFDAPLTLTVIPEASAPVTGTKATGTVTLTADGQELARVTLSGTAAPVSVPVYFHSTGVVQYRMNYSGDANFLPTSREESTFVASGNAAIEGTVSADLSALTVRLTGSPVVAPTGSVSVLHEGRLVSSAILQPAADHTSSAQLSLSGVEAGATVTIRYGGDRLYNAGEQQVRVRSSRQRSVRH
jgi:hypothetical protein